MRVIVVEDSMLLREGLVRVLNGTGFTVLASTGQTLGLLSLVRQQRPDVVVLDIRLPPTYTDEGVRAAVELRRHCTEVGVLLLSQYTEAGSAVRVMAQNAGGFGYLLKESLAEIGDLAEAIRRIGTGGSVIDPKVVACLLNQNRATAPVDTLTHREHEVLALIAEGRSNEAIARHLTVSGKTVETHVRNVFSKLGLESNIADHRRVMAVLTYLRV
ncbi:LuxR C-terminal-related transcriptional regulator [Streptomyces sp. NPDC059788]|uniref:LuxR C-terminal-related transcriptional regulator n=1 Tax=Streptomyces sp. NPDC059788 TaxID=3346948 RepID=UPI0036574032